MSECHRGQTLDGQKGQKSGIGVWQKSGIGVWQKSDIIWYTDVKGFTESHEQSSEGNYNSRLNSFLGRRSMRLWVSSNGHNYV